MNTNGKKEKIAKFIGIQKAKFERGKLYIIYLQSMIVLMSSLKILGFGTTTMILASIGMIILTWLVGSIDYKVKLVAYETGYVSENNKFLQEYFEGIRQLIKEGYNERITKNTEKRNKNTK